LSKVLLDYSSDDVDIFLVGTLVTEEQMDRDSVVLDSHNRIFSPKNRDSKSAKPSSQSYFDRKTFSSVCYSSSELDAHVENSDVFLPVSMYSRRASKTTTAIDVEFAPRSWTYRWASSKWKCDQRHAFRVTIFRRQVLDHRYNQFFKKDQDEDGDGFEAETSSRRSKKRKTNSRGDTGNSSSAMRTTEEDFDEENFDRTTTGRGNFRRSDDNDEVVYFDDSGEEDSGKRKRFYESVDDGSKRMNAAAETGLSNEVEYIYIPIAYYTGPLFTVSCTRAYASGILGASGELEIRSARASGGDIRAARVRALQMRYREDDFFVDKNNNRFINNKALTAAAISNLSVAQLTEVVGSLPRVSEYDDEETAIIFSNKDSSSSRGSKDDEVANKQQEVDPSAPIRDLLTADGRLKSSRKSQIADHKSNTEDTLKRLASISADQFRSSAVTRPPSGLPLPKVQKVSHDDDEEALNDNDGEEDGTDRPVKGRNEDEGSDADVDISGDESHTTASSSGGIKSVSSADEGFNRLLPTALAQPLTAATGSHGSGASDAASSIAVTDLRAAPMNLLLSSLLEASNGTSSSRSGSTGSGNNLLDSLGDNICISKEQLLSYFAWNTSSRAELGNNTTAGLRRSMLDKLLTQHGPSKDDA
jgi:hypothetical protein